VTVGVYVMNDTDPEAVAMREDIRQIAMSQDGVKQMHGFFADENEIAFDIVVAFDHDTFTICQNIKNQVMERYRAKTLQITIDTDYSG
ncbi:MAG: hypothetical protein Q4D33_09660, partial [Prevotellaceae bacterium]|nr:hypothetical protein [Prevotellaceae bacterium]